MKEESEAPTGAANTQGRTAVRKKHEAGKGHSWTTEGEVGLCIEDRMPNGCVVAEVSRFK